MYWVGVDIGGTFTDLVLVNSVTAHLFTYKLPTTPENPEVGFMEGLEALLTENHVSIDAVRRIVHGTTLASNVILERKGRGIALLTTENFRDLLLIQRQKRFNIYDLFIDKARSLLERREIQEIPERMNHRGQVLKVPDRERIEQVLDDLVGQGVRSLAVSFLHSYANPEHERAVRAVAAERHPQLWVSLSSEVAPQHGEYERTSTTVANAYVLPEVRDYLEHLTGRLKSMGFSGRFYLMQSNGGIITVEMATHFPVRIVESGPAAGVLIAGIYARATEEPDVIAFDMGGTTAKMCMIEGYEPELTDELEVDRIRLTPGSGLPLLIPSVDLVEIGTGGGSIVRVKLGTLTVGPDSAGANPGPICYGRGGTEPTVTDANLILGYLNPDYFLGGRMALDLDGARKGIEERLARLLGLSVEEAAWGVHRVGTANMAAAARVVSIDRGKDPRKFALVATGGSAGLHAARMARQLGIGKVIFPRAAGIASAVGLLAADGRFDLVHSHVAPFTPAAIPAIRETLDRLMREGLEQLAVVHPGVEAQVERSVEMRYGGQGYSVPVPVGPEQLERLDVQTLAASFHRLYSELYGYSDEGHALEVVKCKLTVRYPGIPMDLLRRSGEGVAKPRALRKAYFPEAHGFVDCPVYLHGGLPVGAHIQGPALVEAPESTIVLFPGDQGVMDAYGNLILTCATEGVS